MANPERLGKYEIRATLGRGAMGVVYEGFDPLIERTVALKTIRKDLLDHDQLDEILSRFKREAQAAGRLNHPGIVTVYEYGEEGEIAFIAMEYVRGRELKEFLDKNKRFSLGVIVKIMTQLLDALAYSHRHGVVHRDVKPANIIVLKDGRVKVTDFGIAHIESSSLTQFGDVLGTPSYMSPEQFTGETVDARSDLFSAGVILYHMMTGEKPFPGKAMTTIMHRVINAAPIKPSELNFKVPSVLDELVVKALAKRPADRFQSAGEFARALVAASKGHDFVSPSRSSSPAQEATVFEPAAGERAGGEATGSGTASGSPKTSIKPPLWRSTPVLAGAALVVMAILVVGLLHRGDEPVEEIQVSAEDTAGKAAASGSRTEPEGEIPAETVAAVKMISPGKTKKNLQPAPAETGRTDTAEKRDTAVRLVAKPMEYQAGSSSATSSSPQGIRFRVGGE